MAVRSQDIILRIIWRKNKEKEKMMIIEKKRNLIELEGEVIIEIKSERITNMRIQKRK
jgi:hypothetical protein